jgi:signal transduction histidine kinase
MRLAEFIVHDMEAILWEWDDFAAVHIPTAARMTPEAVRDHAKQILTAVAKDLSTPQTKRAQAEKSKGLAPELIGNPETAAETHAVLRAQSGFDINELVAEYRALRASVLRRWMDAYPPDNLSLGDVVRFNEAIDQAISESVEFFTAQVDRARNLFLGMLSHDMRSPLNTIMMAASHLTTLNAGPELSETAFHLTCAGHALKMLLDDMADFNRNMLGLGLNMALADIDLATVLSKELERLRGAHPDRRLELEVVGDTQGSWDGPRLQQVLRNLVSNAIKYGTPDAPVRTVIVGKANEVQFEVTNRGPVIEQSTLKQMFDPLKRGSTAEQGGDTDGSLGLGLYIVREVARAHGGEADVRSAEGVTVFDVRLPRRSESPSSRGVPQASGRTLRGT